MNYFSFGIFSLAGAVFFPALYLLVRQGRRLVAWIQRDPVPKERWEAMIVILGLLGFIGGCGVQHLVDQTAPCRAYGQAVIRCLIPH